MNKQIIITVGREFGSGGRELGRKQKEKLKAVGVGGSGVYTFYFDVGLR